VGRATEVEGRQEFTDNSYLKILQEQGFPGFTFLLGVGGTVLLLGRRLARDGPARRPPAIAALGAVVSFLTLCLFQEYVESAGKVVAWTLLGVALWFGYGAPGPRAPRDDGEGDGLRAA
jgi:O-antigen ligase